MMATKLSPLLQALAGALTVVVLFSGAIWGTAWVASYLGALAQDRDGQRAGSRPPEWWKLGRPTV